MFALVDVLEFSRSISLTRCWAAVASGQVPTQQSILVSSVCPQLTKELTYRRMVTFNRQKI